jgi:hypothetical protein
MLRRRPKPNSWKTSAPGAGRASLRRWGAGRYPADTTQDSGGCLQGLASLCMALLGSSRAAGYSGASGGNHVVRRIRRNDDVAQDSQRISHCFNCPRGIGDGAEHFVRGGVPGRSLGLDVRVRRQRPICRPSAGERRSRLRLRRRFPVQRFGLGLVRRRVRRHRFPVQQPGQSSARRVLSDASGGSRRMAGQRRGRHDRHV